jgi:ribonuclease Z
MKLTILGCYSAVPRKKTNPTSQVLEIRNHVFLMDCGEGTQVELRKHRVKFNRIKHIFISHLHGDHYFGLIGLISTFRLLTRETELHVYGPKGLKEVITLQLKLSDSWTNFPLYFHELESVSSEIVFEDEQVKVSTIPLDHRVYCNGFLFEEKPGERQLDMNAVLNANIHQSYYRKLKLGADVLNEQGELVKNAEVTKAPKPVKKYAFCSDTAYTESIVPLVKGVNALYHESTFLDKNEALCGPTKHSTARQAATIAKLANVQQLILGHYSTRYDGIEAFKDEAMEVFPNVVLADDGKVLDI